MNSKERPQAVAITYNNTQNSAPKIVAKGTGAIAENIVAIAKEHSVPVYKNRSLAGMLMAVELDREIPPELYQAVAEVLAHIFRLNQTLASKGAGLRRGNSVRLGQAGEEVAQQYLLEKGYKIVERNYHTRLGEIDIIALKQGTLVFVEVKTRTSVLFGVPSEFVTRKKQQKLIKAALYYLHCNGQDFAPARFDVIEVLPTVTGLAVSNHIINAFGR